MNMNYIQAVLQGSFTEAQRLAESMSLKNYSSSIADALAAAVPNALHAQQQRQAKLQMLQSSIQAVTSPLQLAISAHKRSSASLLRVHQQLEQIRELLPPSRFLGFVQADGADGQLAGPN